jgi:hypothetical protein
MGLFRPSLPCVWLIVLAGAGLPSAGFAEAYQRLVFGSFGQPTNAERWAVNVGVELDVATEVQERGDADDPLFRVVTSPLDQDELPRVRRRAREAGLEFWRLTDSQAEVSAAVHPEGRALPDYVKAPPTAQERALAARRERPRELDVDLGFQTRSYRRGGLDGQSSFQPSASAMFRYRRYSNDDRNSFTARPFARLDKEDSNRTHADLRELFVRHTGDDWDVSVGFQQVFWGVTEFHHLVDVINQTDLVENIDGEDKLGQPMINLSLVRDWGILDFYAMTGFRERTYPSDDGRLRHQLPVDDSLATYESGDKEWHVDGAVRWSHHLGPVEFGIYHFYGTNRQPELRPYERASGEWVLQPHYALMDQTALDAQAIVGDYLLKLETLTRSSQGQRYVAATGGFERTVVGAFGTRADLGLIMEYMYDDRGDDATTVFEHDLAVGARWRWNDIADTHALFGVIWDVQTEEYIFKLEGGRRLGNDWQLYVQGRVFGGGYQPPTEPIEAVLASMLDTQNKLGGLQRDDFLQIELTRFF